MSGCASRSHGIMSWASCLFQHLCPHALAGTASEVLNVRRLHRKFLTGKLGVGECDAMFQTPSLHTVDATISQEHLESPCKGQKPCGGR
jgi:hypothetical protein